MDLNIQNQALLLKFVHKFMHREDVPWVLLIWYRYYSDSPPQAMPVCGSFWWRDVFSLIDIYRGITICLPNVGDTILLWKDVWNHSTTSQDSLPHRFSFVHNEDISLAQFVSNLNPADNFQLPLSLQARYEFNNFQDMVNELVLDPMVPDDWVIVGEMLSSRQRNSTIFVSERSTHKPT